jgi:hypothetical protein
MTEIKLVVGIDFGTYASGVAWAKTGGRTKLPRDYDITVYQLWPRAHLFSYFKTRTVLLRSDSGEIIAYGNEASIEYVTRLRKGEADSLQLKENFKLDLTSRDTAKREQAIRDAVDYLGWLRRQALKALMDSGDDVPEEHIGWCITMPVVTVEGLEGYDSVLRNEVAGPAGFPADDRKKLMLVAEPEAAAVYWQVQGQQLGERFTVVDAGGGTVDISTLEVTDDDTLDQIGFQAGGRLGSSFLDSRFKEMLWSRLAKEHDWHRTTSPNPDDWATIMTNWEVDKRTWDFASGQTYRVRIPRRKDSRSYGTDADGAGSKDTDLEIPGDEILAKVFDPLIAEILAEFDKAQADLPEGSAVEQVLLVGGFGGSRYLQRRLEQHIADKARLTRLPDPRSAEAILRGTVYYGLNPQFVHARRMQYTYGCQFFGIRGQPHEKQVAEQRRVKRSRWSRPEDTGVQLRTFATRGEVIKAGTVREVAPFYPVDFRDRHVAFKIFATTEPGPYSIEKCKPLGGCDLPVKTPWWQSTSRRPIDVTVILGEAEMVFHVSDRRRPESSKEIKLHYFGGHHEGL